VVGGHLKKTAHGNTTKIQPSPGRITNIQPTPAGGSSRQGGESSRAGQASGGGQAARSEQAAGGEQSSREGQNVSTLFFLHTFAMEVTPLKYVAL